MNASAGRGGWLRTACAGVALFTAVACGSIPDPLPFRGPQPDSILVLPTAPILDLQAPKRLDTAFAAILRDRGYSVPPIDEGMRVLDVFGWNLGLSRSIAPPFEDLRRERGIGAVWTTEVDRWELETAPGYPLVYDLRCSLYSTEDGSLLWTCHLHGEQRTAASRTVINPLADVDPFQSDHPFFYERVHEVLGDEDLFELVARSFGVRVPPRETY